MRREEPLKEKNRTGPKAITLVVFSHVWLRRHDEFTTNVMFSSLIPVFPPYPPIYSM